MDKVTAMEERRCTAESGCWYASKGFSACEDVTDGRCLLSYPDEAADPAGPPEFTDWVCPGCGHEFMGAVNLTGEFQCACGVIMARVVPSEPEPVTTTFYGHETPPDGRPGDMWEDSTGNWYYCSAEGSWISVSDIGMYLSAALPELLNLNEQAAADEALRRDLQDIRSHYEIPDSLAYMWLPRPLPRYAGLITNDPWSADDPDSPDDDTATSHHDTTSDPR